MLSKEKTKTSHASHRIPEPKAVTVGPVFFPATASSLFRSVDTPVIAIIRIHALKGAHEEK